MRMWEERNQALGLLQRSDILSCLLLAPPLLALRLCSLPEPKLCCIGLFNLAPFAPLSAFSHIALQVRHL